jgi:hypothetical protein
LKTGIPWGLLAVAAVLAALVWLLERRTVPADSLRESAGRLLAIPPEQIAGVGIVSGALHADCRLADGVWRLAWPRAARVDDGRMRRLLDAIESADRREQITPRQMRKRGLGLRDYDLLEPRARLTLETGGRRETILLGRDVPLGDGVYARLASCDDVFVTSRALADAIPSTLLELRDRRVFGGPADAVTRLEAQRSGGGFLQLVRSSGGWMLQQPLADRADPAAVEKLLAAVLALRIEEFVWDAEPSGSGANGAAPPAAVAAAGAAEAYGLGRDEAEARVTVGCGGRVAGEEMRIGKPVPGDGKLVYARTVGTDTIYKVPASVLDALSVGVNDLRDRRLFAIAPETVRYIRIGAGGGVLAMDCTQDLGWMVEEPARWKADDDVVRTLVSDLARLRASGFVEGGRTNMAELGLDPPAVRVQLLREAPPRAMPAAGSEAAAAGSGAAPPPRELRIGTTRADGGPICAKFEDSPFIYELGPAAMACLGDRPASPLAYRDRGVLALDPAHVRRIALCKAGVEEAVERGDDQQWAAPASGREAIRGTVGDLLFAVANLRSLRIESDDAQNLAPFGLDRSEVSLSFDLRGDQAIRKTLVLGFRDSKGDVYAMVQGQDLVHVLSGKLVVRMVRDITRPSGTGAAATTSAVGRATAGIADADAGSSGVVPPARNASWGRSGAEGPWTRRE